MIQVYGKTILSIEFKSIIKAHDLNPWQFIYPKAQFSLAKSKPNSHWQHQSLILIGNIKAHFSLAKSKSNSYWQHKSSILIGNIKVQFSLALFCQKRAQDYQYLAKKKYQGKILSWQKPWQSSYKKTHWELS